MVEFSRERILKRLRSKKAPAGSRQNGKPKPPLVSLLRKLEIASDKFGPGASKPHFNYHAARIFRRMQEVETPGPGTDETKLLERLLKAIERFLDVIDLKRLLNILKNHPEALDPGMGKALKDKFEKLAQYRKVALCLFGYARKIELFQEFDIEGVGYAPSLIPAPSLSEKLDLGALLEALSVNAARKQLLLERMRQQGHHGRSFKPAQSFKATASNALSSGKVHAEVQLLFHYEIPQRGLSPRVITSTKSACFLCNALFQLHGKYHIPTTHGRLYAGWLLPSGMGPSADLLTRKLSDLLQGHNKRIIRELMSNSPRRRLYSGNESVIFRLVPPILSAVHSIASTVATSIMPPARLSSVAISESSSRTTIRAHKASSEDLADAQPLQVDGNGATASESEESLFVHNTLSMTCLPEPRISQLSGESEASLKPMIETQRQIQTSNQDSPASSVSNDTRRQPTRLTQGKRHVIALDQGCSVQVYNKFLVLYLETVRDDKSTVEVEWLERTELTDTAQGKVHDVCSVPTDTEMACQSDGHLLLGIAGELVRISRSQD